MKKFSRRIMFILISLLLVNCANSEIKQGASQRDFDHQLQFKETRLTENSYHLIVYANTKTNFNRLATFLLRHSKDLCHSYGYTIEMLDGIQGFNDVKGSPNLILSNLKANITCVK